MKTAVLFACVVAVCGCGPDTLGRNTNSTGHGGQSDLAGTGEDLAMSMMTDVDMAEPMPDACAAVSATATLTKKPVDIIFVIDNSGSMSDEIDAVKRNINQNFAQIIGMSGLDYRVIMLSYFGTGSLDVCIQPPLGANNCTSDTKPKNTANFFHYSYDIESNDSWPKILDTFNKADSYGLAPMGWSQWLRPDSLKVFIEISDDRPLDAPNTATDFDTMLTALSPTMFGTTAKRNYVWYSIIGLKQNSPTTAPWQPTDPVQTQTCGSDAVNAAQEYQKLSITTGGLRFPICEYSSFDSVFQAVANGVVAGSKVACTFDVPAGPSGQGVNLATVKVNYTPSAPGSMVQTFTQVSDQSQCTTGGNFYITFDNDAGTSQIVLCPDACNTVQADDKAQIAVLFDCLIA